MTGIWRSQRNERRIGILSESMKESETEETMMGTVNVIASGRKIGIWTGSGRVTDTGTVIATEGTVTEETATEVNVGLVREIAEVVIGIVEAVIGIMTVTENGNETGRESTLDGPVHVKESGREIVELLQVSTQLTWVQHPLYGARKEGPVL
jgi:hypothetical protein